MATLSCETYCKSTVECINISFSSIDVILFHS